ncbi:hypothetical protein [Bifidobacterium tissieri]|uniref:hypothetical protein n=1 Tax=Bifidobacterium tissieri TaxID=1630162 RepID=UPI001239B26F|nr:hypothetical protein [Bifidobacterium tissieri]KAA8832593.1 hypothetical protein EM849_03550 [Bifidobacterium tissieri]
MTIRICPDCHHEYARLERDGLCPACHYQRLHDQHQPQGTLKTIIGGKPPIDTSDMAAYCRNGHKWERETTREYRARHRDAYLAARRRWRAANKERINARKRELYRLKKQSQTAKEQAREVTP